MDANVDQHKCIEHSVTYKGTSFISRHEFSPQKNGWYYVLFLENNSIYGLSCEFKDGSWIEVGGIVLYWQENY